MRLDHPLSFVVGHPRCPVLILGTKCGRLLSVALRLSHVQVEEVYEDLEVLEGGGGGGGGSEGEKQTETVVRVEAKLSLTLDLHNRALGIPVVEESQGNNMLVAGEDGRLFLVGLLEEEGSFLSVLGSTKVEGEVTDATFRDGTALCLLASEDEAGFRQRRSFSWMGRQICHVRIAPDGKMAIVNMMELKDLCCGIALDRSGCYFFTFILRRKSLGKFVLQEEVRIVIDIFTRSSCEMNRIIFSRIRFGNVSRQFPEPRPPTNWESAQLGCWTGRRRTTTPSSPVAWTGGSTSVRPA